MDYVTSYTTDQSVAQRYATLPEIDEGNYLLPEIIPATAAAIQAIRPNDIIYGEYSGPEAMGMAGHAWIFVIALGRVVGKFSCSATKASSRPVSRSK